MITLEELFRRDEPFCKGGNVSGAFRGSGAVVTASETSLAVSIPSSSGGGGMGECLMGSLVISVSNPGSSRSPSLSSFVVSVGGGSSILDSCSSFEATASSMGTKPGGSSFRFSWLSTILSTS